MAQPLNLDDLVPVAQPVNAATLASNPLQVDPVAGFVPTPDITPAPRAISVAAPLPSAAPDPGSQSYVPPVVQQSPLAQKDMDYLRTMPNDQAFDTAVSLNGGDLRWPLEYFKGMTPDQAAQVKKLRDENGTTWDVADAGKDDLQTLSDARRIYNSLSATDSEGNFIYPNTVKWLKSDPANIAVAKDDTDALANIEQVVKQRQQASDGAWTTFGRNTLAGTEHVAADALRLPGVISAGTMREMDQVGADSGPIGETLRGLLGNTSIEGTNVPQWLSSFFGLAPALDKEADATSSVKTQGETILGEAAKGDVGGAASLAGSNILGSFVPMLAGSIVDPALGVAVGAGSASGGQYNTDLQNGKNPNDALNDALSVGAINAVGLKTYGAIGQLERMKNLFAQPLERETGTQMWGRLTKQATVSATQAGATQAAIQGGTDVSDYLTGNKAAFDDEASKIATAGILGFVADGALTVPLGVLSSLRQINDQETGANLWGKLTGAVDQSKLKQRDPDALADLVNTNLESAGRPTTVNVDADKVTTYFQNNGGDLNKFATDMGTTPEEINNAAVSGSSIDLPIGQYQAKYAGTPLDQALMQHIRFTPGGLSADELTDQVAQVKQMQESIKAELQKTATEGAPVPNQIRAMRELLMADKEQGGKGLSADSADSLMSVLMAGIKHSVALPGESIADAVNRMGLTLHTDTKPEDVGANPDAKGAVQFGPGKTAIHLFKNSDMSTFLHETAHLFLNQRQDLIDRGLASPQALEDHATLHQFVGAEPGTKLDVPQTEKLTRAFESYLREGKAPSMELSGPFQRFRGWLTSIYRSLRGLGQQPSDAVRQVFDRMLASEDDIAHAQEYYSRKGDLLNLIKADEKDKADARAKLAKVQKTELEKQTRAYLKSYLQAIGGMSEIRASAKEVVENQPIYQALEHAKDGKIDTDSLREYVGSKGLAEFKAKFPNLVKDGGAHTLESLASDHNFQSPETLADNLLAAVPKSEAIKNYSSRLVAEKEDQLRNEIVERGATPADGTMHSEGSLAYLIAETNLMAKQLEGKAKPIDAKVYKDAAREIISQMPVSKAIRYADFARTEARLAKQVVDLAKRGQWEDKAGTDGQNRDGALTARKKQIMQHALVQEAIKARDEVQSIARRYSPSKLKPRLDKVENQYLDPIKEVLSRYGLSDDKPSSPFDLQKVNDLDQVLFSQIPTWIVRGENAVKPNEDYRSLSYGNLQDVDGSARSLIEFGIDTLKSNLDKDAKTVAALTEKALGTISQLRTRERRQIGGKGFFNSSADAWAKAVKAIDTAGSHLTKFQFAARWLDFFGRSVHTSIFDGIRDSEKLQGDAQDKFYEQAQPHLDTLAKATNRLRKEFGNRFAVDGVSKPAAYAEDGEMNWSPEELVTYMMNTGSEGNISALKNSFGHGPAEFDRVAQMFSSHELKAMDGLRKSLDSLYPGLDETNFKIYNRHVPKVESTPQDLTDNEGKPVHLDGGYWPLMFNRRVNDRRGLAGNRDADVLEDQTRAMVRAARPQDGFTNSRVVGHSLAPRLDMGVLTDHVDNVTRFTHLAPVIRDANRMMTNPAWRQAVSDKLGEAEYKQMIDWLRYQANPGRKQSDDLNRGIDRMAARVRTLGTKSAMGLNVLSFFKWRTALVNGAVALGGWKWLARGYGDAGWKGLSTSTIGLTSNDLWKEMVAKSKVLGPRESHGVRDLVSDVEKMKWNTPKFKLPFSDREITTHDLKGVLYSFAQYGDRAVVFPVWRGAYVKYMETMADPKMTDEERDKSATTYADDIVQSSQPTSMNVDLSSLHRSGGELAKLLTMFTTYPVTLSNRFRGHYEAYRNGANTLPQFTSNMLQEGALEPLARTFITAAWYGGLPTAAALAIAPMTNAIETIPGMGPIFNSVTKDDATELSPALDWFKLEENLRNDMKAKKSATQIAWDVGRIAGYLTGVPVANVVKPLLNWIGNAYGQKSTFK